MNDQTPIDAAGGCPVHKGGMRALLGRTIDRSSTRCG